MNKVEETIENIKSTLDKGGMSQTFEAIIKRKLKVLEGEKTVLK